MVMPTTDDYGIEQQAIERRRAMAQALQAQSQQAPQGRMAGRIYVPPNALEYLAQGLRGYSANKQLSAADEEQKALGGKIQAGNQRDIQSYITALRGQPAQFKQSMGDMGEIDPSLAGMGPVNEQTAAAAPADPNRALAIGLGSRSPALQAAAGAQLKEMSAGPKWEKIELPNPDGSKRVGYVNVNSRDPLSTFQAGGTAPVKLEGVNTGGNTTFVNPYAPSAAGAPTIAQTGNQFKDLLVAGPDGKPTPNQPLIAAKSQVAAAGKPVTNVSVNTATKPFLTEIGKGVGEQVVNDYTGARSAVQTLNNVKQLESALGNVIVGPGANARVTLSRIGEVLGVNGKDATEQLTNTRNIMQGLARQELAAAGQMKGQGQITESERGILRRAEAGDISELTVPELKTLVGALKKTSSYRVGVHNQNLERLKNDPNAAGVVDYMRLPEATGGGSSVFDQADAILNGGKK